MYSLEKEVTPARGDTFARAWLTEPAGWRAGGLSGVFTLTTIESKTLPGWIEAVVRLARPRNKAKNDDDLAGLHPGAAAQSLGGIIIFRR